MESTGDFIAFETEATRQRPCIIDADDFVSCDLTSDFISSLLETLEDRACFPFHRMLPTLPSNEGRLVRWFYSFYGVSFSKKNVTDSGLLFFYGYWATTAAAAAVVVVEIFISFNVDFISTVA